MAGLAPVVRYLIPCENVIVDPENASRVTLVNLAGFIISNGIFPVWVPELCFYVELSGCRGPGDGRIQVVFADTETIIFATSTRRLPLGHDPLQSISLFFRVRACPFPKDGLYQVQFCYNDEVIAQQSVLVR